MYREMMLANYAQVIMLSDQKILQKSKAVQLLRYLKELEESFSENDLDPAKDDLYFNVERALMRIAGNDLGGRMHTGRSRNDLYSALNRMVMRKELLSIIEKNLTLQEKLLCLAEEHKEDVVTGYTHLQPAQPITLGHYFVSYAEVLQRDYLRLKHAYETTNQSPLGACAIAGTGFPINRQYVAESLGFDSILVSSLDSVASRDYLLEAESAIAIMMSTLSRIAQDLQLPGIDLFTWDEFKDEVGWDTLLLIGSITSLGSAIVSSGLSSWLLGSLLGGLSNVGIIPLCIIVAVIVTLLHFPLPVSAAIMTMSAAALCELATGMGASPVIIIVVACFMAGFVLILPLDPIPLIAYKYGYFSIKQLLVIGLVIGLVWSVLTGVWIPIIGGILGY